MSINIPASVTKIDDSAFSGCTELTTVNISEGVTLIEDNAFYDCSSLTSVTIPSSVRTIGDYVFYNCTGLKDATILEGATTIGDYTFYNCSSLTSIVIPEGVTDVGENAFSYSGIVSITIPSTLTFEASWSSISYDLCENLAAIWVDENNPLFSSDERGVLFNEDKTVLYRAPRALSGTYEVPDGVEFVTSFQDCFQLTAVSIPDSVTEIWDGAFYNCTGLVSVRLSQNIEMINGNTFSGCESLRTVVIPEGVTVIDNGAFAGCSALQTVSLPDSLVEIGINAFCDCDGLTSIMIPAAVTSMDVTAFEGCDNLTAINISVANTHYACDSRCVLFSADRTLLIGAMVELYGSYTVPSSVATICEEAFAYNYYLTAVNIPDSVSYIGERAFLDCVSLTTVGIGKGVTSIGNDAFEACEMIMGVYYGGTESEWAEISMWNDENEDLLSAPFHYGTDAPDVPLVPSIEDYYEYEIYDGEAHIYGSSRALLDEVHIPSTLGGYPVTEISDSAFAERMMTSVVIPDSVTVIDSYAFSYCWNLGSVEISDSVTAIESYAFSNCWSLKSVTIPDGVTNIQEKAFAKCFLMSTVTIPESVTAIGNAAFLYCDALTDVYYSGTKIHWDQIAIEADNEPLIQASLHYDDRYIVTEGVCGDGLNWTLNKHGVLTISGTGEMYNFESTKNVVPWYDIRNYINKVVIEPGVTSIGDRAFSNCSSVSDFTIPKGIATIGKSAFAYCKGFTAIDLPDGVVDIGKWAFSNCISLASVTLPDSVVSIGESAFYYCESLSYNVYDNVKYLGSSQTPFYAAVEGVEDIKTYTICEGAKIIAGGAFSYCDLTSIVLPTSIMTIDEAAFSNCYSLRDVYYTGTAAQWGQIVIESDNEYIIKANIHYSYGVGDLDGVSGVNEDDAIYLLQHVLMPDLFPVEQDVDFDGSGSINEKDALFLLMHVLLPEYFPFIA